MITGNYWLDLIDKEKRIRKEIESTISKMVGLKFSDYSEMTIRVKDAIRIRLEQFGVKHHLGYFNLQYDIDLDYDPVFRLTGFTIKYVYLDEDIW